MEDLELIQSIWPHSTQGSVLTTSRNPNVASNSSNGSFQVQPFNDYEGAKILLKLLNKDMNSPSNHELAEGISHALGGLPLALNQIGAFINGRKIRLEDFLPLYERNAAKIDAKKASLSDYDHTLSTVWEMSLNKLSGFSRSLQEMLAFFNPDKIEERILQEGSQNSVTTGTDLEFLADEFDLLEAEEALIEATLINKSADNAQLSVHRLVQAATMRRLSTQDRIMYLDTVIEVLCWGFPNTWSEDVGHQRQSWERSEMCLPHVGHLVQQRRKYQINPSKPEAFAQLLLRCCWYLYEREVYDTARTWIIEALQNFPDETSLAYASAVELRGLIDMDTNFQTRALESFTLTHKIRSSILGPDDGLIAASLTTLGIVHTELGNLDVAERFHNQAIDIRSRTNSDRIGNSYSNMASLLLRMGKPQEAEDMLKRCPSLKDFTDETFLKTGNPRFSG